MNRTRTFFLMVTLTILFVVVGGAVGGQQGAMIAFLIAAMLIRMAVSRTREYAADQGGADISGQSLALATALGKLHKGMKAAPLAHGNPAHSHMFIMNPFFGGLQKLFSTHPPAEKRMQRLRLLAEKK